MDIYLGFKNADGDPSAALPSQEKLMKTTAKHILAAGSLGWGKTDWLVLQAVIEALSFKGYDDPPEILNFIKDYIDYDKLYKGAM